VVSDLNAFLEEILQWSLTRADSEFQRDAALELLASILNKRTDADCKLASIQLANAPY
jgi:DNA repair/transcription protein MET18/MMS19